ncbi:MAG: universal stress protein [Chloroflexi bacterium]|nr:universal stress protein [Chloroflexota bacterium]
MAIAKAEKGSGYERILIPISGEETDDAAIRLGCNLSRLARKTKCKIIILYVIQVQRSLPLDATIEREVQKGEQALSEAQDIASDCECDVRTDVLQARDVGVAIVDEAVEQHVDVIVMGAGYKRRFGVFAISPTAQTVLRDAPCRVIVIRPTLAEVQAK